MRGVREAGDCLPACVLRVCDRRLPPARGYFPDALAPVSNPAGIRLGRLVPSDRAGRPAGARDVTPSRGQAPHTSGHKGLSSRLSSRTSRMSLSRVCGGGDKLGALRGTCTSGTCPGKGNTKALTSRFSPGHVPKVHVPQFSEFRGAGWAQRGRGRAAGLCHGDRLPHGRGRMARWTGNQIRPTIASQTTRATEVGSGINGVCPRFLAEQSFVRYEMSRGFNVSSIPTGRNRTPDFNISGTRVELKTISGVQNPSSNSLWKTGDTYRFNHPAAFRSAVSGVRIGPV